MYFQICLQSCSPPRLQSSFSLPRLQPAVLIFTSEMAPRRHFHGWWSNLPAPTDLSAPTIDLSGGTTQREELIAEWPQLSPTHF